MVGGHSLPLPAMRRSTLAAVVAVTLVALGVIILTALMLSPATLSACFAPCGVTVAVLVLAGALFTKGD